MRKRNIKKKKKSEIGFFKSLNLSNDNEEILENFVFEIQKNSSNSLEAKIFNEDDQIRDVEIWSVIDSKIDITLNKISISRLKKIFLVSPVAILRLFSMNNKIVNVLVNDLFVVRKSLNSDVYIRFSEDFEAITEKDMLLKYKDLLTQDGGKLLEKIQQKSMKIISNEQKRIVNEQYSKVQKHYKMTKNKEYDVNIFSKMDYHSSRISVLKEFLYNEIIKNLFFTNELANLLEKRGVDEN